MPGIVCQLILPVSSASRADSVGMSGVLRDFCYTMSLPWEAGEDWEILISKCRLAPVGSRPPEVVMGRDGDYVVGERGRMVVFQGVDVSVSECNQCLWRRCWDERTAVTVGVFACLQVDSDRRDLDMNNRDVDAKKLTRFVRMNELRLVTEYDPVVIISFLQSSPLRLAFSSWCPLAPVCIPTSVWGLEQWCRWDWGSHTALHCYSTCGLEADLLGLECGGRGRDSSQFL